VTISTDYSGAAPETIDRELTAVIERAAGRVPGLRSISSESSFGDSRVTAEFSESTDIDVAAADLRDAVNRVARSLPDAADDPRIVKADGDAEAVLRVAITSDIRSAEELTLLVENQVLDRFTAIEGVADLRVFGGRDQVFRIDVDQSLLASRGLSIADLSSALGSVAFDAPAGSLSSDSQDISVRARSEVTTVDAFEALAIDENTRIGDVASVTLGPDLGSSALRANGQTGVGLAIIRQAGSSTLAISRDVHDTVAALSNSLPEDVSIQVTSDDATFIGGAIREVLKSLGLAILIVVAVIFLFLRNARATLIPAITLPVALIGTVAGLWAAGFSINILTLLALVLATGLVVDDAIVVLENIVRRRREGLGARAAAVLGTREVFFTVITTTATLAAVFIPLSFLPGKAGGLFREFGFTLAIAVILSSVVALSLCPMLASRLLQEDATPRDKASWLERFGNSLTTLYARSLRGALAMPWLVVAGCIAIAAVAWVTFGSLREELLPREDRAVALLRVSAPQGVSLDYTAAKMRDIEELAAPLVQSGEVQNVFSIAGSGGANGGFAVFTLIALTGDDYTTLSETAEALKDALENEPGLSRVRLSYETNQPQLSIDIDRQRAADLGIAVEGLAVSLQSVLDGRQLGEVFINDRAVAVKLVSSTQPVDDPTDLANLFLRSNDGRYVPMSSIATLTETAIAPELGREQRLRAINLSASLDDTVALRQAWERAQALAEPLMPPGMNLIPLSEAATLDETSSGLAVIFGFALVVVFLVLAMPLNKPRSSVYGRSP